MTASTEYAQKKLDETKRRAGKAFAEHCLISNGERWWHLARRKPDGAVDSRYSTDVYCGHFGEIYVGGDIDVVVFSYFSDSRDLRARLAWIGRAKDLSYYVARKAAIGMSDREYIYKWDEDYARLQLQELKQEMETEEALTGSAREAIDQALEDIGDKHRAAICADLYTAISFDWLESLGDFGMLLSGRVVYAWAALGRLCDLLGIL